MRAALLRLGLLAAPLLAQELPEPGALPAFRAQMRAVLSRDPMDAWRSYVREGLPAAVVEVVATYTEAELSDMAFQESVALLRLRLHEMWGRYGDAASRDHATVPSDGSPARLYPLGRPLKP